MDAEGVASVDDLPEDVLVEGDVVLVGVAGEEGSESGHLGLADATSRRPFAAS